MGLHLISRHKVASIRMLELEPWRGCQLSRGQRHSIKRPTVQLVYVPALSALMRNLWEQTRSRNQGHTHLSTFHDSDSVCSCSFILHATNWITFTSPKVIINLSELEGENLCVGTRRYKEMVISNWLKTGSRQAARFGISLSPNYFRRNAFRSCSNETPENSWVSPKLFKLCLKFWPRERDWSLVTLYLQLDACQRNLEFVHLIYGHEIWPRQIAWSSDKGMQTTESVVRV